MPWGFGVVEGVRTGAVILDVAAATRRPSTVLVGEELRRPASWRMRHVSTPAAKSAVASSRCLPGEVGLRHALAERLSVPRSSPANQTSARYRALE
jgi:hypothetical protein